MRVGATLWDGPPEGQDNVAGCVKAILPTPLPDASMAHRLDRPVIIAQPVPVRLISDQEASGPQNVFDIARYEGVNIVTSMAAPIRRDPKAAALHQHGTLNPRPEAVHDPLFVPGEFFDARDLVQVKYEMVRRVQVDGQPVSQACSTFGFTRPVFYKAQGALAAEGLPGLVPKKRGPRAGHKLTGEILEVLEQALVEDRTLGPLALVQLARERCGVTVHPRSVQRALARRKKKP